MWPQIVYVAISLFGLGIIAAEHGKPRKNQNFFVAFAASLIGWSLLYAGGFFNVFFGG